jgi:signal transduction histidine kinase
MSVWRRPGRRSDPAHDEALLRIIASQTGHALESAEALVEVARQRDVVARQEKLSALGSLVAGVAHEVNNPLTYLGGNIELALLDLEDLQARYADTGETPPMDLAETHRLLSTALGGAQRIGEIVKALRAVARAKGSAERERVPMNRIAQNVCELMRIGVPDRVVLRCEPDAQDPAVMGFSSELHQVVLNLAKNAVEATTEKGGAVVVSVGCTGDRVELRVADEGEGMTEEVRKRLFTPFFTTKGASGTGLGLSIVGSIVKEHGGEIAVESEVGKGTTFRVVLPRA